MRLFSTRTDPSIAFLRRLRKQQWRLRSLRRSLLHGALVGIALVWAVSIWHILAADNLHEVRPQQVYRAGQMSTERLREFLSETGVRTVVNLRGCCTNFDWYRDECRVTHDLNVSQEDITLSAIRLPSPSEVRRLLEVLDHSEYPILLHCRQGVDRTGLAAVMVKLLDPETSLGEARRQLALPFGYVPYNGTENMARFFDLYQNWLETLGCQHSPALFRQWASREYCPGRCRARLEWLDGPQTFAAHRGQVLRVRAHNTSVQTWPLRAGTDQGVHARYRIAGPVTHDGRAGQFDAEVPPGHSIDLTLGVPPLPPGTYTVTVDLVDVDENAFSQFGVSPLTRQLRIDP